MSASRRAWTLILFLLFSTTTFAKDDDAIEVSPKEFTLGEFAFSPDAKWLVTCGKTDPGLRNDVAYVWNTADGSLRKELVLSKRTDHRVEPIQPTVNAKGNQIWFIIDPWTSSSHFVTAVWSTETWSQIGSLDGAQDYAYPQLSGNGEIALVDTNKRNRSLRDRDFKIFDTKTISQISAFPSRFPDNTAEFSQVRLINPNLLIAQRRGKKSLEAWSIKPMKKLHDIKDDERIFQNWKVVRSKNKAHIVALVVKDNKWRVQVRNPLTGKVSANYEIDERYIKNLKQFFDVIANDSLITRVGYERKQRGRKTGRITHHMLELATGKIFKIIVPHVFHENSYDDPVYAISRDGTKFATEAWSLVPRNIHREISVHKLQLNRRISKLVVGDEELTGRVPVEKNEGRLSGEERMLRFSPDGSHVAYRFSRNSKEREAKKNLAIRIWKLPK